MSPSSSGLCVRDVTITPVAVKDPPLLNSVGVHQPYALRAIVEVGTDAGLVGLGETYGDEVSLGRLGAIAARLPGLDPFDIHDLSRRVWQALGQASTEKTAAKALAPFDVACLDLQGKAIGRPVSDLLGGAVRDHVPFSGYLFYRWGRHPNDPGYPADEWGEALSPDGIVAQARQMTGSYGFTSLKLKGGVRPPAEETEAILALRDAFPGYPLRLDPNANWTVATSIDTGRRLDGALEYLEDPCAGIQDMARVNRAVPMPLATNMCVTAFSELPAAIREGAVDIVLADHHYWGGLRESQRLAGVCGTFRLGLSMHSNTHLGISLAAMTHLAAACPDLRYACDTHLPWQVEDVIEPGSLRFEGGAVPVPRGAGLGVRLDRDSLARLHRQYLDCGITRRDDVAAMREVDPAWVATRPRF